MKNQLIKKFKQMFVWIVYMFPTIAFASSEGYDEIGYFIFSVIALIIIIYYLSVSSAKKEKDKSDDE